MATVTRENFSSVFKEQVLPALERASFVAIDLEMTGIESASFRRPLELDTLRTRYLDYRHSAENFDILQLGVCTFEWNVEEQAYVAHPFNFHAFSRCVIPGLRDFPSRTFLSQTSSIEFLSQHGVDFNHWIRAGISYLSEQQAQIARQHLGLDNSSSHSPRKEEEEKEELGVQTGGLGSSNISHGGSWHVPKRGGKKRKFASRGSGEGEEEVAATSMGAVAVRERACGEIEAWSKEVAAARRKGGNVQAAAQELRAAEPASTAAVPEAEASPPLTREEDRSQKQRNASGSGKCPGAGEQAQELHGTKEGEGEPEGSVSRDGSLLLSSVPPKLTTLVAQMVRKRFPLLHPHVERHSGAPRLRVFFCESEEERRRVMAALADEDRRMAEGVLEEAIGLSRVLWAISASGKPLVGHNCALDLAHILTKFFCPLPDQLPAFSSLLTSRFPCIFDTKFMARSSSTLRIRLGSNGTSLSTLYEQSLLSPKGAKKDGNNERSGVKIVFADALCRYNQPNVAVPNPASLGLSDECTMDSPAANNVPSSRPNGQKSNSAPGVSFAHEAGFDAYMTGVVFAKALDMLGLDPEGDMDCLMQSVSASRAAAAETRKRDCELQQKGARDPSRLTEPIVVAVRGGGAKNRTRDANRSKEDLFASIAANMGAARSASGSEGQQLPASNGQVEKGIPNVNVGKVAALADALTLGRQGTNRELVLDLWAPGQEGSRTLPAPKFPSARREDRANVALAWGLGPGLERDELRKLVQRLFPSPPPFVTLSFLDDSAAFFEFTDPKRVGQLFDILQTTAGLSNASSTSTTPNASSSCKGPAADAPAFNRTVSPTVREAALLLREWGVRFGPFQLYERVCASPVPFATVSEALQWVGGAVADRGDIAAEAAARAGGTSATAAAAAAATTARAHGVSRGVADMVAVATDREEVGVQNATNRSGSESWGLGEGEVGDWEIGAREVAFLSAVGTSVAGVPVRGFSSVGLSGISSAGVLTEGTVAAAGPLGGASDQPCPEDDEWVVVSKKGRKVDEGEGKRQKGVMPNATATGGSASHAASWKVPLRRPGKH